MAISRFYKTPMIVKRKVETKINGVSDFTLTVIVPSFKGAFAKARTIKRFESDKEIFDYTHIAEMPVSIDIKEDDILEVNLIDYNVESVVPDLFRNHHLEVFLTVSK